MDLQNVIVLIILTAAILFVGATLLGKARGFLVKQGCGSDCGCNAKPKKLHS